MPIISSKIFGSKDINNIPINEEKIKIHFFNLILSFKNNELIKIENGIDNCAPIVIGANNETELIDRYKNIFTPAPIQIENPIKGNMYFFSGIIILQKGNKHKKTKPILKAPKNRGFIDAFKPNLPKGYALPKKNITKTIKPVCFGDKFYLIEKGSSVGSSDV